MTAPDSQGPGHVRAFLAIDLAEPVRHALARIQEKLKTAGARVTWTAPENFHITLRFLGDVRTEDVDAVIRAVDEATADQRVFEVACEGLGAFGSPRRPSVVWAGCPDPAGRLADVHRAVEAGLASCGFAREERPFHAHVTLGRLRRGSDPGRLTSRIDSHRSASFGISRVEEILVVRSDLSPRGPLYTVLHRSCLKGD